MEGIWCSSGGITYDSQAVSPVQKKPSPKYWKCGRVGHLMKNAPRGMHLRETGDCPEAGRFPAFCPKWIT
jgi:hypothetical protein